ncbi:alpha/beta fold hydrolase [Salimicrobium halophilum]|uniref:Pimeloyl-ACP methyl ester carboxylesterase n=1 Tax=Salimicrobium halophilum TaxID=86666 RepID=A0A1G8R5D2_9BACI|nr:alpha/beta hydrolase [Salimicrobium halophilum]SDJ12182.1 Pimeloyl-ACP methyl ester carboxylesterase [Salimicrobium halophilum]
MILHTEVQGDGEAVVFLHSGLQTGKTDFVHQKEMLKDEFKTIAPDLRGHGNSVNDDLSNFFEDAAEDLKKTMDHLKIHSFHLVGCSLGALVAIVFAKKYPSSLISITLSGITADKPENWKEIHKEDVAMQQQLLNNEEMSAELSELHKSDWKQFIHMAEDENWYPFDYTTDLYGIKAPILIITGEENKNEVITASKYQLMHDNVHVGVIPFGSHLIHEQQPAVYNEMLANFLR